MDVQRDKAFMEAREAERARVRAFVSTFTVPKGDAISLIHDFVACQWTNEGERTWTPGGDEVRERAWCFFVWYGVLKRRFACNVFLAADISRAL